MLNLIDEHTRECLLIRSATQVEQPEGDRGAGRRDGVEGVPEHIRSDNGPEFVAKELRKWLAGTGAKTLYIEPGSPWENGYCESFNSKLRDEFLNGEIFYSMKEIRCWRSGGASTTTPSGRTPRWATDHRRRRHGWQRASGHGEVETAKTLPTSPHPRLRRRII